MNSNSLKRLIPVILLSTSLFTQAETEPRWYQVDLLIFTNSGVEEANPEQWPTFSDLVRPDDYIELIYPDDLSLLDNSDLDLSEEALNRRLEMLEQQRAADAAADEGGPQLPVAFEVLPQEQHVLAEYAKRLDRDRRYRILFNQAWAHPIMPEEEALPIYLTGGETFGTINELAGLVKIHVSRYLHVATDLHFTEVVESDSPFELLTGNDKFLSDLGTNDSLEDIQPFGGLELFAESNDEFLSPQEGSNRFYVAVSSAKMDARRRLRSGELHYIDNPKFGLLIYFTPIDMEALMNPEPEDAAAENGVTNQSLELQNQ